jgi:hypothetical protein
VSSGRGLVVCALAPLVLGLLGAAGCGHGPGSDAPGDGPPPLGDAPVAYDAPPDPMIDGAPFDGPPGLPDLQFAADLMVDTVVVTSDIFTADDCEVVDGCVGAPGRRTLLRFDTVTSNLGTGDLVMGVPPPPGESNAIFEWSPCHMHHHVKDYASYQLIDGAGNVLTARKQSFCLEDGEPVQPGAQPHGYSCINQGISRGWADVYARGLACQWIDITDLSPGAYTLRVEVNPLHTIPETDTTNNVFTTSVAF